MMNMDALFGAGFKIANFVDTSGNPPASKVYRAARIILSQQGIDGYYAGGSGAASQEQLQAVPDIGPPLRRRLPRMVPFAADAEAITLFAFDPNSRDESGECQVIAWINEVGVRSANFGDAITVVSAATYAARGIRVNCVAPGPVWTPLNPADDGMTPAKVAKFGQQAPIGRPAQPEELAPAYVFLASNADSSYITGTVLQVMGGETSGG